MPRDVSPRPKRVVWRPGLVVAIPVTGGGWGVGQTADLMMPNVGYVALFAHRCESLDIPVPTLARESLIGLVATTRHAVSTGHWPLIDEARPVVATAEFPNERFAVEGYIGAKLYDPGVIEDFLGAYHGLHPWNGDFIEEDFLDQLLLPGRPRPREAILLSPTERIDYRRSRGLP